MISKIQIADTPEHRRDGSCYLGGEGLSSPQICAHTGGRRVRQAKHQLQLLTIALAEAGHLLVGIFCALWRITEVRGAENCKNLPRVCPASLSLPVSPYKHIPALKSAPQQRLGVFPWHEEPSHEDFGVRAAPLWLCLTY